MDQKSKQLSTIYHQNGKQQNEEEDQLSNLPDVLLLEILTLLPMKLAVSTSVLSQRWRNLWTLIIAITIDFHHFQNLSSFYSMVDGFISQLASPFIRSFSLQLDDSVEPPSAFVDSWFHKLCSRNVESISVALEGRCLLNRRLRFNPPPCVFQTPSLIRLQFLNPFECEFPDIEVNLPHLKILDLQLSASQCWIIGKLTRACPFIEVMRLTMNCNWDQQSEVIIDILGLNLKQLSMCFYFSKEATKFVINAPNLRRFKFFAGAGSLCSFSPNPSALLHGEVLVFTKTLALSVLQLFSSVKFLNIGLAALFVLKGSNEEDKGEPLMFRNLKSVVLDMATLNSVERLSWTPLDFLSPSLLTHVEYISIKISKLSNETNLLNLTKSLLSSARALKKFTLCVSTKTDETNEAEELREFVFCKDVYECQRSSSECHIRFYGKYVTVLADGVVKVAL